MKSVDLPVGAHVAYDRNKSRNYPSYVEAYVFAHRPRGNKSSYWGSRTGNGDTVGLAYKGWGWNDDDPTTHLWLSEWVPPASIYMPWDEWQELVETRKLREAEEAKLRKANQADRAARLAALPASALKVLGVDLEGWRRDMLVEQNYANVQLSVEMLEALVAAVLEDARPASEKLQAEVEAALKLLA